MAEVTGLIGASCEKGEGASARLVVENHAPSANLAETSAFMDDQKRILVFSDAGAPGAAIMRTFWRRNQRLRVHYLLEPGWKADTAIQGLGRTNRTNQAQPPLFRPIATDVKAEERFLSTIARRLDTLGAITRGQRQPDRRTGPVPARGQSGIHLRSRCATPALSADHCRLQGRAARLNGFETATGLKVMDANGIKDRCRRSAFLNRLLALTIELQGILFSAFEQLLQARINRAIASGTYDMGLETLKAESFVVTDRQVITPIRAPARKRGS
ncbi:MAG: strawberry notch C-terminal domain-containing protein [Paracoccaceae bacterium]